MMKLFLFLLLSGTVLVSFTSQKQTPDAATYSPVYAKDSVYICYSSTSYAYHSSLRCRGLNRCTHQIIKVSLEDARDKYHHRPCKICE